MSGIFSSPKAPPPPPPAIDEGLSRREMQAEKDRARENKRFASRNRARRGSKALLMTQREDGDMSNQDTTSTTLGVARNPRAGKANTGGNFSV
jgi:hypothetical protein